MLRINILLFLAAAGVSGCWYVLVDHCASNTGNFFCPPDTPWCNGCNNSKTGCQREKPKDSCKAFSPDHCASQTKELGGADEYCAGKDMGARPICDGCVRENDGCVAERNNPDHCYEDDTGTGSSSGGTETSGSTSSTSSSGSTGSTSSTGSTGSSGSTGGPTPCGDHAECAAMGAGTDYCKPSTGECVPCLEDVHCTMNDAAACNTMTNECEPCTENPDCDGVTGMDVCDDGACVQCTPEQEEVCMGKVCSALTNICTDADPGTVVECAACEADSQCEADRICVTQVFMGQTIGHFCFPIQQDGSCVPEKPYSSPMMLTSVEGVSEVVCVLDLTTCPARNDYGSMPGCKADDECGAPKLPDGLCRMEPLDTTKCTYPCNSDDDCPTGSTCPASECTL